MEILERGFRVHFRVELEGPNEEENYLSKKTRMWLKLIEQKPELVYKDDERDGFFSPEHR